MYHNNAISSSRAFPYHVYTYLNMFCYLLSSSHVIVLSYLSILSRSCGDILCPYPICSSSIGLFSRRLLFCTLKNLGFLYIFIWLLPRIFHCFLLLIAMIISYHGVSWLGQLKGHGFNHSLCPTCKLVGCHPCIFQTCFPLLENMVHLGDINFLWVT